MQLEGLALLLCTAMVVCGCTSCFPAVLVLVFGVCTADVSYFSGWAHQLGPLRDRAAQGTAGFI